MDNPIYFKTPKDLRKWFIKNHLTEEELIVGYYKIATGKPSITWSESVDEAICFGWIDGIRHKINEECYCIRFTPRKTKSNWSAVNIVKARQLIKEGKIYPAGLKAFHKLDPDEAKKILDEKDSVPKLKDEFTTLIKANKKAWKYFHQMTPGYRNTSIGWVMSAKREETRLRRLQIFIESCEEGKLIPQLRRP